MADTEAYTVKGVFSAGKGEHPFERTVTAASEEHAEELVFSQLSSEHGISRANIAVDDVEAA